ncbi:ATP-dependent 6-phosphofructokinase [soil metagenome]
MTPRVYVVGAAAVASPLRLGSRSSFVADDAYILRDIEHPRPPSRGAPRAFERAGPREHIYFDTSTTKVGIVTAGGVCPGINDVIRAIVLELHHGYGVGRILGFRYGFAGLDPASRHEPMVLEPGVVRDIHVWAGTLLGTSRGPAEPSRIVDTLARLEVNVLIVIGGDGTMRAGHAVHAEIARRGLPIGVIGVPKTIDNDIAFVDKTFGFETAVATARLAIDSAHAEARSVVNGVGLVKLMGRNAGFIAASATLASQEVNACLVPEVPFDLAGDAGMLTWLEGRLARRGHAVVVVAEGCASSIVGSVAAHDASGNVAFSSPEHDVGRHLQRAIQDHFAYRKLPLTLKYIDPSYMVRATRASAEDAVFCDALARNAVHAAMAGKTDMLVGRWHRCFTHVPLDLMLAHDKRIDPAGDLWRQLLESTGQPAFQPPARG